MIVHKDLSKIFTYVLISLSIALIGCSTKKIEKSVNVSPNQAQIVGEIVSVDQVDKNKIPSDLCTQYPCLATVKIKSINYGAGFPILSVNGNIKIKFAFTLAPTDSSMFPNMEKQLPGLKKGDIFTAIVSYNLSINSDAPNFQIYSYLLN